MLQPDEIKKLFKGKDMDPATFDQRARFLEDLRQEKLKTVVQVFLLDFLILMSNLVSEGKNRGHGGREERAMEQGQ